MHSHAEYTNRHGLQRHVEIVDYSCGAMFHAETFWAKQDDAHARLCKRTLDAAKKVRQREFVERTAKKLPEPHTA